MNAETLGPAERIIQTLLTHADHMQHGRVGIVTPDRSSVTGVKWQPASYKEEEGKKVVYRLDKVGTKTNRVKVGVLADDKVKNEAGAVIADYRPAGLFREVAQYIYRQIAEVWKVDNEFAARWASYAFMQDHRDLKVALAAFMLVQSRKGDPVVENGQTLFHDEDYRDVGEAMMLLYDQKTGDKALNPRMLLRIHEFLCLPEIAAINRELGFGKSAREPFLGRWDSVVHKWLRYRERNPKLLEGLVKHGFRSTVMQLVRSSGYKPETAKFFEILRWKQHQAKDGRRTIAIGVELEKQETWEGMSEAEVCERIMKEKVSYKRLTSLIPKEVGVTRAVLAAAIEAGCLSDKELIIHTPTIEDLGLLQVQTVRERLEKAIRNADDMRAANIAARVKHKETKEQLQEAAEVATKKAIEEVVKGLRIYFIVDRSASMSTSIQTAIRDLTLLLPAFPLEQVHVAHFNTTGQEVRIQHASAAGVANAFRGVAAGGGTDHGSGVRALSHHKPKPDEDALYIWVGDEGQPSTFERSFEGLGYKPVAFGLVRVPGENMRAVTLTAAVMGIPCFEINEQTFADPYAIPRVLRNLIAATPVGQTTHRETPRKSLVDVILSTPLLSKPQWAA
jgi:hypothetical protein